MQDMKSSTVSSSLSSMIYSMPLLSINVVIVGLFDASGAVQVHATPQMWTPINSSILKQITFSPLSRQLWEKNNSSPSPAYSFDIPSREHCEDYCLGSCQTTSGEDWSLKNEQPDEFSSVMTNSGGAVIGGCGGGLGGVVCCVLLYILYRYCIKSEPVPDTNQRKTSNNPPLCEGTFPLPPVSC